jgi:hypothetical protein
LFTEAEYVQGRATGGKIGKILAAGVVTEYELEPGVAAGNITRGRDGKLWFIASNNVIGKVTTAGVVTKYSGIASPTGGIA